MAHCWCTQRERELAGLEAETIADGPGIVAKAAWLQNGWRALPAAPPKSDWTHARLGALREDLGLALRKNPPEPVDFPHPVIATDGSGIYPNVPDIRCAGVGIAWRSHGLRCSWASALEGLETTVNAAEVRAVTLIFEAMAALSSAPFLVIMDHKAVLSDRYGASNGKAELWGRLRRASGYARGLIRWVPAHGGHRDQEVSDEWRLLNKWADEAAKAAAREEAGRYTEWWASVQSQRAVARRILDYKMRVFRDLYDAFVSRASGEA